MTSITPIPRCALILALALTGAAQAQTIRGAGARPCAEWNQARIGSGRNFEAEQWALGYMSAVSATAMRVRPMLDERAIFAGLDGYCRTNPQEMLWDALKALLTVRHGT